MQELHAVMFRLNSKLPCAAAVCPGLNHDGLVATPTTTATGYYEGTSLPCANVPGCSTLLSLTKTLLNPPSARRPRCRKQWMGSDYGRWVSS